MKKELFKKIVNSVLSVLMVIGLFTVSAAVDSSKYEVKAEGTSTTLATGQNFNQAIKRLAGNSYATYNTSNTTITAFERSATAPASGTTTTDISKNQDSSVVAWFDNGTIYWYSEADTVYMNEDSSYMFYYCNGLTSLDVSDFDTSNVTYMGYMFNHCSGLTSLDVTSFNTSNVTNMNCMFHSCSSLRTIYAGTNWNTNKVTSSGSMFYSCSSLVGSSGTTWSSSNPSDKTYAHIDGGTSNPGYFTAKN